MHHFVTATKTRHYLLAFLYIFFATGSARAATGGSISGVTTDPTGAMIAGATLKLVNTDQHTTYQVVSDRLGFYSFPNLPVGHYDLTVDATGFAPQKKTGLAVDTDAQLAAIAAGLSCGTPGDNSIAHDRNGRRLIFLRWALGGRSLTFREASKLATLRVVRPRTGSRWLDPVDQVRLLDAVKSQPSPRDLERTTDVGGIVRGREVAR